MAIYNLNELKNGMKIVVDNSPYSIIDTIFVKPGKGQPFTRIKMRNLKTYRIIEKTYKSGDTLISANIIEINVMYLYTNSKSWNFMHTETFEQYEVGKNKSINIEPWLKEGNIYVIILWDNNPIQIIPPNFINLTVTDTNINTKCEVLSGNSNNKLATLETGITIKVPIFIKTGDIIKVDTRNKIYCARLK